MKLQPSHTVPGATAGTTVDGASNEVADAFNAVASDGVSPTITSGITTSTTTIDLTASETITSTAAAADFTVNGIGVNTISTVIASGTIITITLATGSISDADTVTVDYARVTGSVIDASSNILANFVGQSVTNSLDTTAPTLNSAATVTTTTIDVTFSEDLDGTTVAGTDFTVAGHTVSSATESSPGVVTITLSTTMGTAETPLVMLQETLRQAVAQLLQMELHQQSPQPRHYLTHKSKSHTQRT